MHSAYSIKARLNKMKRIEIIFFFVQLNQIRLEIFKIMLKKIKLKK
jgi:hypothetical protein